MPSLEEALKNLYDVVTQLGLEAEPAADACIRLLDQGDVHTIAKSPAQSVTKA